METVTYLFGAGASAGLKDNRILPVINELPARLEKMAELLGSDEYQLDDQNPFRNLAQFGVKKTKRDIENQFRNDLQWLANESRKTASVDTLARKYDLKGESDLLEKLKIVLSAFFSLEQAKIRYDKRYEIFFTSIIKTRLILPSHIRVLSWNYDIQFEMALSELSYNKSVGEIENILRINEKFHSDNLDLGNNFSLTKINGTAKLYNNTMPRRFVDKYDQPFSLETIESVINLYGLSIETLEHRSFRSNLSFAWETDQTDLHHLDIVDKAIQCTSGTTILVVIGYSFPFFNREIDRKIINSMPHLRKVYFQAPDADNLKERFLAIRDGLTSDNPLTQNLVTRFDLSQFVLPNEI